MRKANGLNEFYSRTMAGDSCEVFLDEFLEPTIDYPHIHIVHHGNGTVDITSSVSSGNHPWRKTLRNPNGNEVNAAIKEAGMNLVKALMSP